MSNEAAHEIAQTEQTEKGLGSPFNLNAPEAYRHWRENKLERYPTDPSALVVEISDLTEPSARACAAIRALARKCNMAIYRTNTRDWPLERLRPALLRFAARLGLERIEAHRSREDDGLVALEVSQAAGKSGFIPYTNRPLNWHTDGYYNPPSATIRGFLLHCVRDAAEGGENGLYDPELAYIRLRDNDPAHIRALMHPEAMTIPESVEPDGRRRPASTGPVFSLASDGALQMRYTSRRRNIIWRDDPACRRAVAYLNGLLAGENEPLIFKYKLRPGEGILCNNVLHSRAGFVDRSDGGGRLYLRARYLDRIAGT